AVAFVRGLVAEGDDGFALAGAGEDDAAFATGVGELAVVPGGVPGLATVGAEGDDAAAVGAAVAGVDHHGAAGEGEGGGFVGAGDLDRKSTRLNSSHTVISYAVFCLKKKKI